MACPPRTVLLTASGEGVSEAENKVTEGEQGIAGCRWVRDIDIQS